MRILLITQEIDENSDLLGVILVWIRHLAPKVDRIDVLAHRVGAADLPANVTVSSMGKERSASKLVWLRNFYSHLWRLLRQREIDLVFVHMVPRYAILAAPLARLFGVPIVLWNAHGTVSRYLRIAHRLVAAVVTASPESFRINSPKRIVTGHGIDTDFFTPGQQETAADAAGRRSVTCATGDMAGGADDRTLQNCATGDETAGADDLAAAQEKVLLSVGRISRSKDYGAIIHALAMLRSQSQPQSRSRPETRTETRTGTPPPALNAHLRIIGTPFFPDDHVYLAELESLARERGVAAHVTFAGKVPNRLMVDEYRRCDVLVNASHTGSIDKVVLEAMACAKPAVTCNESFATALADYADLLMFAPSDAEQLADRLIRVLALDSPRRAALGGALRRIVIADHSVVNMTDRFVAVFARITGGAPRTPSSAR